MFGNFKNIHRFNNKFNHNFLKNLTSRFLNFRSHSFKSNVKPISQPDYQLDSRLPLLSHKKNKENKEVIIIVDDDNDLKNTDKDLNIETSNNYESEEIAYKSAPRAIKRRGKGLIPSAITKFTSFVENFIHSLEWGKTCFLILLVLILFTLFSYPISDNSNRKKNVALNPIIDKNSKTLSGDKAQAAPNLTNTNTNTSTNSNNTNSDAKVANNNSSNPSMPRLNIAIPQLQFPDLITPVSSFFNSITKNVNQETEMALEKRRINNATDIKKEFNADQINDNSGTQSMNLDLLQKSFTRTPSDISGLIEWRESKNGATSVISDKLPLGTKVKVIYKSNNTDKSIELTVDQISILPSDHILIVDKNIFEQLEPNSQNNKTINVVVKTI
jgi:hypothetical protein